MTLELNSHADTYVLGRDALIIQDYNRPVEVTEFDPTLGSQYYQTISGVVAYTHPTTGEHYHLVIHQVIHFPHLTHHLLCSMQCRMNDVIVNNIPKFLIVDPIKNTHAIIFTGDDDSLQTILPLDLWGVILSLNVSAPSKDEWTAAECTRLVLTSKPLTWDPTDTLFDESEHSQLTFGGDIHRTSSRSHQMVIQVFTTCSDAANIMHDDNFAAFLDTNVAIDVTDSLTASGAMRSRVHMGPSPCSRTTNH
jgi:hypothetical protein